MSTTVLLVDDHELIRQGLRRAFERNADFEVVGEAGSDRRGASASSRRSHPDVIVVDVRLPDGSGLDLVRAVRKQRPDLGIVVLTMYAGDEQLFGALDAGASAFVPKDAPTDDVLAAARHAAASPQAFTARDLAEAMKRRMTPSGPQLSPREKEVLPLLADGLGVAPISRRLYISESTDQDPHLQALREARARPTGRRRSCRPCGSGLIKQDEARSPPSEVLAAALDARSPFGRMGVSAAVDGRGPRTCRGGWADGPPGVSRSERRPQHGPDARPAASADARSQAPGCLAVEYVLLLAGIAAVVVLPS